MKKIKLLNGDQTGHYIHSVMSQFLSAPRTTHLEAVIRDLRYLNKAPGRGFFYSDHGHIRVTGFSDTDWE